MVAQPANDSFDANPHTRQMARKTINNPHGFHQIHMRRQPRRPHYLRDWIDKRNFKSDAEFAEAIGADKSVVSRWLDEHSPTSPGKEWQHKLGVFFGDEDDPADIFRHPDDDWMAKFLRNRRPDEIERIKQTMETAFPPHRKRG